MEYTEVRFSIECEPALKDIAADLLTDMASDCGFEAFTNESDVLTGYAQTEEFDKFGLDNMIAEFPLENVTITYTIDKAPNENWNTTWEDNGFEPIDINGKCVIYDARHVDDESVANDDSHRSETGVRHWNARNDKNGGVAALVAGPEGEERA